jgi:hypothetical protein
MSAIKPYLKAVLPALLTLLAIVTQWAVTGAFDKAELVTAITGFTASLLTFLVSNQDGAVAGWPLDLVPPADLAVDAKEPVEKKARKRVRRG